MKATVFVQANGNIEFAGEVYAHISPAGVALVRRVVSMLSPTEQSVFADELCSVFTQLKAQAEAVVQ